MEKKVILLATFTDYDYLDKFLTKIHKKFGVKKKSVFMFETEDSNLVLTYRLFLEFDQKLNIRKELPKTIQIHKKGSTFFTINSLNKLIERDFNLNGGNVNYSKYEVDWDKYKNCLISLKNNNLEILSLSKKIIE
jgi:hypothetical protein